MIGDEKVVDDFVSAHRWAVFTTLRDNGMPVNSIVAYARDADDLVISTPDNTFKVTSISQDSRVNMCILSDAEPFDYVAVEGRAVVQYTDIERATRLVFDNLREHGYSTPDNITEWLQKQRRAVIRVSPERVYGVIR